MNERIRELVNRVDRIKDMYNVGPVQRAAVQDFVNLIVLECMQVCKNEAAWDPAELPYKPSEQFHDAIGKHFGVEG